MQRELADERGKERKEERANVFLDPHPDSTRPRIVRGAGADRAPRERKTAIGSCGLRCRSRPAHARRGATRHTDTLQLPTSRFRRTATQRTDRTHLTHVNRLLLGTALHTTEDRAQFLHPTPIAPCPPRPAPHTPVTAARAARRRDSIIVYRFYRDRAAAWSHTTVLLPALGSYLRARSYSLHPLQKQARHAQIITRRRFRSAAARAHLIALVVSLACHRRPVRGSYAHAVQRNPEREPANLDRMLAHRHVGVASLESQTPHPRCCVA